ncbi:MAG: reverse transcriptase domain-containing protein [Planctomycetota bacterium]|nr:reverse transcriptase domain-containing protein [Planctomycetota bacterium]
MSGQELNWHLRRVELHRGDDEDFATRLKITAKRALDNHEEGVKAFAKHMVRWIADERNLNLAFEHLQTHGGASPGPDGLTFDAIETVPQKFQFLRGLRDDILEQVYIAGPTRKVQISKRSGNGHRTLMVQDIGDRIVHRGIMQVMRAILDPQFDNRSFGFRPRRNRCQALALVERLTLTEHRKVWVTEDIRDAFPNVPITPLLEIVRRYLPAKNLVQLIRKAIDTGAKRGLGQGSPLSPLLLNLYLHHHLDRRWRRKFPSIPLIRVADDLLLLCRTADEGIEARSELAAILTPAGMPLKGTAEDSVRSLARGQKAEWLGYACGYRKKRLVIELAEQAVDSLIDTLDDAAWEPNAGILADQIVRGWLEQAGPAYRIAYADTVCDRIASTLQDLDLSDVRIKRPNGKKVRLTDGRWMRRHWKHAHDEWRNRKSTPASV